MENQNINYSIKDLYINIQNLYNNAINMLTALNQSLQSTSSEITVTLADSNDTLQTLRIPSFIYLENKLEQLETKFSSLFEMPETGEAWFNNDNDMYKLEMVRPQNAPITPIESSKPTIVKMHDNNFLKDLVSPKMYFKFEISNLPNNVEKMYMKKLVFHNANLYTYFNTSGYTQYSDFKATLYNYKKGEDYDEYESELKLPIKQNTYISNFEIEDVVKYWYDYNISNNLRYDVVLNTISYQNEEDPSIEYNLEIGDSLWLGNEYVKYTIIDIDKSERLVTLEEVLGHIQLQPIDENNSMVLHREEENFNQYKYVEVPLEEDPYICIFLGIVYNGVRSIYSTPYLYNLNEIYVEGTEKTYIDYYKEYCTNIGDIILGISQYTYPQLSEYSKLQINNLQGSDSSIQQLVTQSIDLSKIQVSLINSHLVRDELVSSIKTLNSQKSEISQSLDNIQNSIDSVTNTLINTDFSQNTSLSYSELSSNLKSYQTERVSIIEQYKAVVDSISIKSNELKSFEKSKYRIRGVFSPQLLIGYLNTEYGVKSNVVAIDVQYRYKSQTQDTSSTIASQSVLFTEWNKYNNIERNRIIDSNGALVFDDINTNYDIANIIKWNQLDIPIKSGEDVVLRIRYKYCMGQPFFNLYTPWSDEITIEFPSEYENSEAEISSILSSNDNDKLNAAFNQTLVNDGYYDHITNKTINGSQIFYHQPENIFSGFYDENGQMLSIKEKMNLVGKQLTQFSTLFEELSKGKFEVYITYDDNTVKLQDNAINKINIYNTEHIAGQFIRKEMTILFKNIGSAPVKFYSIFPGNTDIPLIVCNKEFMNEYLVNYERYPIFINNSLEFQTLGQWVYFRTNNPFTEKEITADNERQKANDIISAENYNPESATNSHVEWVYSSDVDYIGTDDKSATHGFRARGEDLVQYYQKNATIYWKQLKRAEDGNFILNEANNSDVNYINVTNKLYDNIPSSFFRYTWPSKTYILRYEDIYKVDSETNNKIFLDNKTKFSDFLENANNMFTSNKYQGALVFSNFANKSDIISNDDNHTYRSIEVGETISLPIVFEFYLEDKADIQKSLFFDIRPNVYEAPKNYLINFITHNDYTSTGYSINTMVEYSDQVSISE